MFCSNCGERIDTDSHFCVHCGHRVQQGKTEQPDQLDSREEPLGQSSMDNDLKMAVHAPENNGGQQESDPNQFHETSLYEDMITYVGKNANYYDQRWRNMDQTSSKYSWNFAAFFLSFFWLGYRRLFKELFIIIGLFIVMDLFVILLDIRLDLLGFVNFGLGLVVWLFIGFYGNYLYRGNVKKKVHLIRTVVHSQNEKETLLKTNGGSSTGGVFAAIGVFAVYFCIIYYLLFSTFGVVAQVEYGTLYEYPDVTVGEAFDDFFDRGKWKHQKSSSSFKMIEYTGVKTVDGEEHDIKIDFILNDDDEFHFNRIVVDSEELDDYDSQQFIEFVFDDSVGMEYW